MLKKSLLVLALLIPAVAQADFASQLNAIKSAETSNKAAIEAEKAAAAEKEAARQRAIAKANAAKAKAAQEKAKRDHELRMAKLEQQKAAEKEAESERLADKYREQQFQDELRKMEIEERKLELAKKRARANREDEMIDAELARRSAETDFIQSNSDAKRNVSEGMKANLESQGRAKEAEADSWFK